MGIFSKKKKEAELTAVFDIGSSSVGAALFYKQNTGVPKIIFSIREPIKFEEKIEFDKFLSLTMKSLDILVKKISLAGFGAPLSIFCVLSSPWYVSQTRHITLQKNVPFLFTSKLADNLTQREITLFKEEHLLKYANTSNEIRQIEIKNIKTMLNGYAILDPLNKQTEEIKMSFFVSMAEEKVLKNIEEVISKHFHTKNIKFSSFLMASFAVVRDLFINQEDFLLIDISGEVTDISIVKKDTLSESISYPLGRNFMIRGIAGALDCSLDEAKSFLSLYKDGHALESFEKKLEPVINQLKNEWLKVFQESLVNLSNDISIPATVFITIDQGFADFFSEIIKNEQFNQYVLSESKFKITFLGTEALHGIASFQENVIRDPFMILESVYINRFLH